MRRGYPVEEVLSDEQEATLALLGLTPDYACELPVEAPFAFSELLAIAEHGHLEELLQLANSAPIQEAFDTGDIVRLSRALSSMEAVPREPESLEDMSAEDFVRSVESAV